MPERYILQHQLLNYVTNGPYPLHMPGHKRRVMPAPGLPQSWDLTEVEGVDDLHAAEGILRDAMERTAVLHHAARTWYLVGGSTCGLLAGIRALAPAGSRVICARNCHKAVYYALELGGLRPRWLMPPLAEGWGVCGSITPDMVREALEDAPDAACVILTSPTYEGVISDIAAIADLCHEQGVPLLVDEAHGAHLGLFPDWPDSAVTLGADLVVQSAHKTLPSLTQTAYLHLGRNSMADPDEVERQLGVFETSSPSYPLMASLDGCTGILRSDGAELFRMWRQNLDRFDRTAAMFSHLRVLCHGADSVADHPAVFDHDPGKLLIRANELGLNGPELAAALREQFGFELEMSWGSVALAMTSMCDEASAFDRLAQVLTVLDRQSTGSCRPVVATLPPPGRTVCTAARAVVQKLEAVPLEKAKGRISGEYVWAYPPGVPLVAPGEEITDGFLEAAAALSASGTPLRHTVCKTHGAIQVLA